MCIDIYIYINAHTHYTITSVWREICPIIIMIITMMHGLFTAEFNKATAGEVQYFNESIIL